MAWPPSIKEAVEDMRSSPFGSACMDFVRKLGYRVLVWVLGERRGGRKAGDRRRKGMASLGSTP